MRLSDAIKKRKLMTGVRTSGVLIGMLALTIALTGCVHTPPKNPVNWPEPITGPTKLKPGDVLRIQFVYWPELDDEQTIRPDGQIQLKMIGAVQAAGLTPEELQSELVKRYDGKILDPEIALAVDTSIRRMIYVTGEVLAPGMIMMEGDMTALEALQRAGGQIKWSARLKTVVIIRQRDGKQYGRTINLKKALQDPTSEPFIMEPNDIMYVPRTRIEKVDQWADQYINKLIPDNVYLHFNKSLDDYDTTSNTLQVQTTPF